jgi:hypothetical protein
MLGASVAAKWDGIWAVFGPLRGDSAAFFGISAKLEAGRGGDPVMYHGAQTLGGRCFRQTFAQSGEKSVCRIFEGSVAEVMRKAGGELGRISGAPVSFNVTKGFADRGKIFSQGQKIGLNLVVDNFAQAVGPTAQGQER